MDRLFYNYNSSWNSVLSYYQKIESEGCCLHTNNNQTETTVWNNH